MCIRSLPDKCHQHSQCQGTEKCCYNDCRRQCTPTVKEKPGNCPRPEIFCSHRDWQDGRGSCTTDRDCPGREKCCAPRCRRECKNVDGERPGKCPEMRDRDDRRCWGPPRHECANDDFCLRGQKCCTIGCWRQCVYV
ncbi:hypothetical protein XENTR_v10015347 [Xenopus tropicalis]|nr:hypothetical protein XENTR_v10015347 [Xenopus tropicalis]